MSPLPQLGANVVFSFAPDRIEQLCKVLADHRMPIIRYFIDTDFAVHDRVFDAAQRHGLRLCPTLPMPKDPVTQAKADQYDRTIGSIVERYRSHPALDTWILLNEPKLTIFRGELAQTKFRQWLIDRYGSAEKAVAAWTGGLRMFQWEGPTGPDALDELVGSNATWRLEPCGALDRQVAHIDLLRFFLDYHTWYMNFLADCVRRRDPHHPTHANPDQLGGNLVTPCYDLPAWRASMDILGATLHPGWTFGRFRKRQRYALVFSCQCDLLRGAAEPHPFWISELQGGTNIYEGISPTGPTGDDMAQWTWVTLAAGAQRIMYWCLNPMALGREAGGWTMLDYQFQPSERLETVGRIADILEREADFFTDAAPIDAPVTILLGLEAMAVECYYDNPDAPGRSRDAHVEAARGFYEALAELGIPIRIKHLHDFDFNQTPGERQLLILPNLMAMTDAQAAGLTAFVKRGHTVLATGLTGMYGPHAELWPTREDYPLAELFGGTIRQMRHVADRFDLKLDDPPLTLPAHLMQGEIRPLSPAAEVIARDGQRVTATRCNCGAGETIWIPSHIGLGAWLGDCGPLARLMETLIARLDARMDTRVPFRFAARAEGCVMRVMRNGTRYLTVVTNGTDQPRRVALRHNHPGRARVLWGDQTSISDRVRDLELGPRQTVVLLWE